MKLLVSGDRNWSDYLGLAMVLDTIHERTPIELLIEGCATGADRMAGAHPPVIDNGCGWAWMRKVDGRHFPANWERYGRSAGPVRNAQMLAFSNPDLVVAFHDDIAASRGTAHMLRIAKRDGFTVRLYGHRGEELVQLL